MGWDPVVCTPLGETTWGQCEQSKSTGALGPYLGPLDWAIDLPWNIMSQHVQICHHRSHRKTQIHHGVSSPLMPCDWGLSAVLLPWRAPDSTKGMARQRCVRQVDGVPASCSCRRTAPTNVWCWRCETLALNWNSLILSLELLRSVISMSSVCWLWFSSSLALHYWRQDLINAPEHTWPEEVETTSVTPISHQRNLCELWPLTCHDIEFLDISWYF